MGRTRRARARTKKQVQIGIVTAPMPIQQLNQAESYLYKRYVTWVQMAGANAVIIPYNTNTLATLLSTVHGVLWVGGGIENTKTHSNEQYETFVGVLESIFDHAVRENDRGNYFPLWGTCLGFDILAMLGEKIHGGYFKRIQHAKKFRLAPLVFNGASRLRSGIPKALLFKIAESPVVTHIHEYGFDMKSPHTKKLTKHLKIVSVDQADNGVEFMNMFEYKNYPFYGSQWHPEKPLTDLGVELSNTLSVFFKNECSNNKTVTPRWTKLSESSSFRSKDNVLLKGGSYLLI
jgi:gamma-glutamyl hydrolase